MTKLDIKARIELEGDELDMPCINQLGFEHSNEPVPLEEHIHPGFEFTYIDNGRVTWELGDKTQLVLNGKDMALTQPQTPHKGELDVISPTSLFWVSFDFSHKSSLRNTAFTWAEMTTLNERLLQAGNFSRFAGTRIPYHIQELYRVVKDGIHINNHNLSLRFLQGYINFLLMLIVEEIHRPHDRTSTHYSLISCQFIEENITRNINTHEIAEAAGISEGHLYEVFKKEVGMTPMDYIQRLRCERAKSYLQHTQESITGITFLLGFNSTQYFATCFKKYTGLTPSEYRKKRSLNNE